jgi:glycolate oxidase iron-sulfur subunit
VRDLRLTALLPRRLRELEPATPRVQRHFSDALIAEIEPARGDKRHRVALLTGCVQDLVFSDVNRATADVLRENGCEVVTPRAQHCCGSLHAHNGDLSTARELARRMIDLLPPAKYDAIISNAGGCGSHLRRYGPLLEEDPGYSDAAIAWDARLRDVHEWLGEIGCRPPAAAPFDSPVTVTYHESCHLAHGQKIVREPRALLRLLPGLSVVELKESSWCCGAAGIYAFSQPEQAALLLERKVSHVLDTGASIVATGNPGCQMQIARGLRERGGDVRVVHPISLMAAAYRREAGAAAREPLH